MPIYKVSCTVPKPFELYVNVDNKREAAARAAYLISSHQLIIDDPGLWHATATTRKKYNEDPRLKRYCAAYGDFYDGIPLFEDKIAQLGIAIKEADAAGDIETATKLREEFGKYSLGHVCHR